MRQMKDSGIKWIGLIPQNWKVTKIKHHLRRNEPRNPGDCIVLSLYRELGIVPKDSRDDNHNVTSLDTSNYKYVRIGDFVINKMKAWQGSVAVSDYEGIVSPAYYVYNFLDDVFDKRYFHYLLRSCYKDEFRRLSGGIREGQWDLSSENFDNTLVLIPPLNEQKSIACQIDNQCAHIDNIIEKTKASIEEYKKLRQAVITQAVTKGVRGDRAMKDSGIEWIGEIPEEWDISRVGLHFDIILGKMLCPNQINDEYTLEPYYCAANVHFDGLSTDSIKEMWFSPDEKVQYKVKQGDLLVVEGGAGAGGSAIVTDVKEDIYIQNSIMIVRSRKEYSNVYLRYLIEYLVKSGYIDIVCNKATIPHFTKDKLGNVPFILNDEQNEIASFLDKKCAEIDTLIAKKEQFLTELESYKKSMIYEYVTGKKEVPKA